MPICSAADPQSLPEFVHVATSITSLPVCSPRSQPRARAADHSASGTTRSTTGQRRPCVGQGARSRRTPAGCPGWSRGCSTGARTAAGDRARSSARWWRRRSPAGRRAGARGASPASAPRRCCRRTTSAPRPSVSRRTSATTSAVAWLIAASAPSRRADLELGVGAAGHDRPGAELPGDLERRHRHAAADAPDEHASRPAGAPARVVSIRHAVSVASENAAAWAHGIVRRHRRQVLGRHDHELGRGAGPVLAERRGRSRQSDSSPSRQAAHAPQERPGLIMTRSPGRTLRHRGPDRRRPPRRRPSPRCAERRSARPAGPSATKRSSRLSAAAWIRTRTSSGALELGARQLAHGQVLEAADAVEREGLHRRERAQNDGLSTCSPGRSGTSSGRARRAELLDAQRELRLPLARLGELAGHVGHALAVARDVQRDHRLVDLEHGERRWRRRPAIASPAPCCPSRRRRSGRRSGR